MAFIPLPNGVSLCFDFVTAGQFWQTCFTLRKSAGAPTSTDLEDLTTIGSGVWTTELKPNLTEDTTLRQVRATDMTVQGGPQHILTVGEAAVQTGPGAPLNACAVISGRTAKRGRSYRGRNYISGLLNGDLTDPVTLGSGIVAILGGFAQELQDQCDTNGFDVVVPSRQHNGAPTNPAELNEVVAWVVDNRVDSQRRRLAGRGS